MAETRIRLTLLDGDPVDFKSLTYMCTADRVAFERHFSISSADLAGAGAAVKAVGEAIEAHEIPSSAPLVLREEWIAFFTWRAAVRAGAIPAGTFEAFVEDLAEIELEDLAEVDPTVEGVHTG